MKLSISTKLFAGFAVVIMAFSSAAVFAIVQMQSLRASVTVIWRDVVPLTLQLRTLSRRVKVPERFLPLRRSSQQQSLRIALLGITPFEDLKAISDGLGELDSGGSLAERDAVSIRRVRASLDAFRQSSDLYEAISSAGVEAMSVGASAPSHEVYDRLTRRVIRRLNEGDVPPKAPEIRALKRSLRRIDRVIRAALRELAIPIKGLHERAESDERDATLAVILAATLALLISLAILLVSQLTLKPLRQLREGVQRVAQGDLRIPVEVTSADEIGQLAEEFNRMAATLRAREDALREQREELLRSERLAAIGKLAAQITHEVRNPLSSIGLNAELLEEELEGLNPEAVELLEAIQSEIQRVKGITEDYLRFARMPQPDKSPIDVGELLTTITRFIAHEVERHGVTLEVEGMDQLNGHVVAADPDQLRQVIINLINNALEALQAPREVAAEEPPRIVIGLNGRTVEDGADVLEIAVRDNGPGIDPDIIDRIFEPFVTNKSEGTGLGLAMSQKIILEHGGALIANSPSAECHGTEFVIQLPAKVMSPDAFT